MLTVALTVSVLNCLFKVVFFLWYLSTCMSFFFFLTPVPCQHFSICGSLFWFISVLIFLFYNLTGVIQWNNWYVHSFSIFQPLFLSNCKSFKNFFLRPCLFQSLIWVFNSVLWRVCQSLFAILSLHLIIPLPLSFYRSVLFCFELVFRSMDFWDEPVCFYHYSLFLKF